MPEREPVQPEIAKALRAYELEVLDGTERSQRIAFERLRTLQRSLGKAATNIAGQPEQAQSEDEPGDEQLAAS